MTTKEVAEHDEDETVSTVLSDMEAEGLRLTGNINRNVDRIVGTNLLAWERRLQNAYENEEDKNAD